MQERAALTRRALIGTAAAEFDSHGYEGTTLARICKAAGISIGALSYHFAAKRNLAEAVAHQGEVAVRDMAERVLARQGRALESAIGLTLELARLLERDVTVRAAARLGAELRFDWSAACLSTVSLLLEEASAEGQLRSGAAPASLATLAAYLVGGAESRIRARSGQPGAGEQRAADELAEIWAIVMPEVRATVAKGNGRRPDGKPDRQYL
ncbi:TetR family transcriptional regulator [Streptomyces sp. Je 1-332]|uniref:TetR family transcriptional regulator n=1 Tax=Streptomyces sp. Je 1-332 TaxID=3231270 RepID=UPI003459C040